MEPTENVEEYLEALWIFEEKGVDTPRIIDVSGYLFVAPPSAVEMLRKMESKGYVNYKAREGVSLTGMGRDAARRIIRNHRLAEVLMKNTLHTEIDEKTVCGIEHHMTGEFSDALCTLLGHPAQCPHGNKIPRGRCCK